MICDIDFDSLEWLEYNLKCCISFDCAEDEKTLRTFVVKHWLINKKRTPFLPLPPENPQYGDREIALRRRIILLRAMQMAN